jgi:site-specific recombinase XerC
VTAAAVPGDEIADALRRLWGGCAPAKRIDAYLASRDDVTALPAIPGSTAAPRRRVLFATGTGARMYRAAVRALLRRLGRAAGLPADLAGSLSPHSMRHASPRTTRRYDRSRGNLDRSPGYLLAGYIGRAR